jgi:hypothetical protein
MVGFQGELAGINGDLTNNHYKMGNLINHLLVNTWVYGRYNKHISFIKIGGLTTCAMVKRC